MNKLIEIKALCKVYDQGLIQGLSDINLTLETGKIYALMGPSGCGKSTLLNLIGTLDTPSNGEILYEGMSLDKVGSLSAFRRDFIGFVFQFHHLIPVLTLRENVESALLSNRQVLPEQRQERALNLLEDMGILHRAEAYANEISGGERQRGAIARALINCPKLLLADEPTGNVDSKTARLILKKLKKHIEATIGTILIATHDPNVAEIADVIIEMEDGRVTAITNKIATDNVN
ncbi:MAG: ABC transporter ATP-binding protein [Thiomicrorhabdus chilensis]|uniref:ABC transporter ATP-binding protein n=1 Tax=Thiomicrorhabdus chilensis TaxID=63656 RepID=UPI00299DE026|nr:ABC transporter ATP-binding protein [Thiomicrorhabdus chilensis]MDX1347950.1 ABC transporter ATP-binding protein [Thiomicrorhabdus chilensis]